MGIPPNVREVIDRGPFRDDWASLEGFQTPAWYQDSKFGIFIGRDVVGEIAAAVREQQMAFGVSSHRAEHWWFFNGGMEFPSDVGDPAWAPLYGPAQPEEVPPSDEFRHTAAPAGFVPLRKTVATIACAGSRLSAMTPNSSGDRTAAALTSTCRLRRWPNSPPDRLLSRSSSTPGCSKERLG